MNLPATAPPAALVPPATVEPAPPAPPAVRLVGLRAHRRSAGLSQAKLARLADIGQDTVSRLEAGKQRPSDDTAYKLSRALNVPAHVLFPEENE